MWKVLVVLGEGLQSTDLTAGGRGRMLGLWESPVCPAAQLPWGGPPRLVALSDSCGQACGVGTRAAGMCPTVLPAAWPVPPPGGLLHPSPHFWSRLCAPGCSWFVQCPGSLWQVFAGLCLPVCATQVLCPKDWLFPAAQGLAKPGRACSEHGEGRVHLLACGLCLPDAPLLSAFQKWGSSVCLRVGAAQCLAGGWTDGCMADGQLDKRAPRHSCWEPPVVSVVPQLAWELGRSAAWLARLPLPPSPGPWAGSLSSCPHPLNTRTPAPVPAMFPSSPAEWGRGCDVHAAAHALSPDWGGGQEQHNVALAVSVGEAGALEHPNSAQAPLVPPARGARSVVSPVTRPWGGPPISEAPAGGRT